MIFNVAENFSRLPNGRDLTDGSYTGQHFYLKMSECLGKLDEEEQLVINFDNLLALPSSFLEEAFGSLIRNNILTENEFHEYIVIESNEVPDTEERINKFVADAYALKEYNIGYMITGSDNAKELALWKFPVKEAQWTFNKILPTYNVTRVCNAIISIPCCSLFLEEDIPLAAINLIKGAFSYTDRSNTIKSPVAYLNAILLKEILSEVDEIEIGKLISKVTHVPVWKIR